MKHLVRLTLLASLLTCTGCGTMIAFDRIPAAYPGCRPGLVYAGTMTDISYGPNVIVSVLDIPLSLIADTLLLPYTVSAGRCAAPVAAPEPAPPAPSRSPAQPPAKPDSPAKTQAQPQS